jgi:hypothetical protein
VEGAGVFLRNRQGSAEMKETDGRDEPGAGQLRWRMDFWSAFDFGVCLSACTV